MNRRTKKRIQEFTFIVPALIMFSVFVAYPFPPGHSHVLYEMGWNEPRTGCL